MVAKKIESTPDAWESGALGRDEKHAVISTHEDGVDEALELKMISIRLPLSLIEDYKKIAAINGMAYQPFMRKMLTRFAEAEKKVILAQVYNEVVDEQKRAEIKADTNSSENHEAA